MRTPIPYLRSPGLVRFSAPLVGLLLLVLSTLFVSCSGGSSGSGDARAVKARPGGPRLTVLFAVCTLNKDYLSPYNPEVRYTPTFEQIASAGLVFDRHQTEAGQSGTSYASLFSGCQADAHKVYTHPTRLDDGLYLMAEAFRDSGWIPWYWYGHPMADPKHNYGQGVAPEHLVNFKTRNPNISRLTPRDPDLVALLDQLAADPEMHAEVTINFSYTHGPYTEGRTPAAFKKLKKDFPEEVPFTYDEMEHWMKVWEKDRLQLQWNFVETKERVGLSDEDVASIATAIEIAYKSGIYMLDQQLAWFMKTVQNKGLLDELCLAFTADHGQVLFRESATFQWTHGLQLAPEVLNVPMIVYAPKLIQPGRYPGVSRSIDVYPTLAGLSGIELSGVAPVYGVDLSEALLGNEPPPDLVAFSHSTTINPTMFDRTREWTCFHELFPTPEAESLWVGARRGDLYYKWRSHPDRTWSAEVFDLAADRDERINLYDASNKEHVQMVRDLQTYKDNLVRGFSNEEIPESALDDLQNLGYTEGDEEEDGTSTPEGSK